ncbi:MAG: ankyrin repeat domain-containing protein [Candidatus Sericytochromatia bacterium]|nr:ankyrin repeat domain-containing protein [Candidatus Sericytochromatia bacterium]
MVSRVVLSLALALASATIAPPAQAHVNQAADMNRELLVAAAYGHLWRVRSLVEGGANVNWRDEEGYTPLTWAAQHGHTAVVDYLLGRFAGLNPSDKTGYTPLMWAAQEGHTGVVELLLRRGANPYVQDARGANALTLARWSGNERVYAILREAMGQANPLASPPVAAIARPMVQGPPPGYGAPLPPGGQPPLAQPPRIQYEPPVVAPPVYETFQALPLNKDHGALVAKKSWAVSRLADESYRFRADYASYVQATATHLGWNAMGTLNDPDMEIGKYLNAMYANVMKGRDLTRARRDLGRAKNVQDARGESLFSRYIIEADKILRDAGW